MRSASRSTGRGAPTGASLVVAVGVGAVLAGLAVVVDEVALPASALLIAIFSTGLSWGVAAAGMGAVAAGRAAAATSGLLVLVTAVGGYYLINFLFALRDTSGSALLRAGLLWGIAALMGGPILGLLGWHTRFGDDRQRSVAYGVLAGLLLGQGLRWALRYGLSPHPVFTTALVVPLLIFFAGVRGRAVGSGVLALVIVAVASAQVWRVLEAIN
jgi:hypothetical protein